MNYSDVKEMALFYADRQDSELSSDKMDMFLKVVESRVNKAITVREMSRRATVPIVADQEYYGLPSDFIEMRDLEHQDTDGNKTTAHYIVPMVMNAMQGENENSTSFYYTIIADQIQIFPIKSTGILEMVYMQRVPALTANDTSNWLSDDYPEIYVFGLLVEISSFAKDAEAAQLWDLRFKEALDTLSTTDARARWSGTPLTITAV